MGDMSEFTPRYRGAEADAEARAPGEDVEALERALPVESIDGGIRREVCPLCRYETHQGHEEGCWADAALSTLRDLSRKLEEAERSQRRWFDEATESARRNAELRAALEEARRERDDLLAMMRLTSRALEDVLAGRPVRNADEIIAEARALSPQTEEPETRQETDCPECDATLAVHLDGGRIVAVLALSPQPQERDALGCLWCDEPAAPASNLCPEHRERFVTGKRAP